MPRGFSLAASAMILACAICAPAKAQVVDQPGGDLEIEPLIGGAADAVYSNLDTFRNQSFAAGGATQQVLNTITRLAADDLNLIGTPPYSVSGFRFTVTNLNDVDVSARPLVRFYLPNGPGGGPGTLIEARTYNPIVFTAGVVGTIKTSSEFVLRSSAIWAGIAFDNNGGATGATAAQLDNLAQGIFSPPEVGTSTDQYFVTTAAGSFASDDPVGTLANFGGAPPANFGWEILTAQDVDLSITKSDGVATAVPGGSVVYTITASNAGPDTVFDARVVDSFPASLTCSWACVGSVGNTCAASGTGDIIDATVDLLVGGSVTYTATCAVDPAATGTLANTASIFAPGTAVEAVFFNNSATDSDTIVLPADLAITKSHTGNFVQGQPGTYTLTVSNVGGSPTSGSVTVIDDLPAGLVPTVVSGTGWTCDVAVQDVSCNRSDPLAPGQSYPAITLTVSVLRNAPASVTNTAVVFGGGEVNPSNNTAPDPTTIAAGANLTITKSHAGNFTQGQTGTYTLTVSNIGGSPTDGPVLVTDSLPAGLAPTAGSGAGWSCTPGGQSFACTRSDPLAPGASYPATTLTVAVAANAPASVTNIAMVAGGGDVDSTNASASDPTTIIGVADLTISKTHTGSFLQGQVGAQYRLSVSNIGGGPTSSPVTVNDSLPAGLTPTAAAGAGWVCNIAGQNVGCSRSDPLNAGATYPVITLTVNVAPAAPPSLTNTATVSGGGEVNTANDMASDITTIGPGPDLTINKSHSGSFRQGQIGAIYTITVSNPGSAPSSGVVTVADNVPVGLVPTSAAGAGWICTISGQDVTCTQSDPLATAQSYPPITVTVNVLPGAPGSVTNAVAVSGGGDVNSANNSATDLTAIIPGADLTITKSHTGNFTQGQTATYTVTVTNVGVGPTSGTVVVADPMALPLTPSTASGSGWTCAVLTNLIRCQRSDALAPGASYPPITMSARIAPNAPPTILNIATVDGSGDGNASNNSASDTAAVAPAPDLAITKSHTGNFVQGQPGAYTLTVSNVGGSPTSGSVAVIDDLPAGLVPTAASGTGWTCSIAAGVSCNRSDPLAPGQSYPAIALAVSVLRNAPPSVTNTAVVFGGGQVNLSNTTAVDPTTITAGANLTITKSHASDFTQGQTGTYTVTVSNTGGSPTNGTVLVTDSLPAGLAPTGGTGAGWSCTPGAHSFACTRSDPLAPGATYPPITLTVAVAANAPAAVTNTAMVAGGAGVDPSDNSASDPTTIAAAPTATGTPTLTPTPMSTATPSMPPIPPRSVPSLTPWGLALVAVLLTWLGLRGMAGATSRCPRRR